MDKKYIIALDQGTTSSRAVIFNHTMEKTSFSQREFTQYYPKAGWVEHDAEEIFNTSLTVMKEAIEKAKISGIDIAAIGITNQRETVVLWDKDTGKSIYRAIVWQCRRTADIADKLIKDGKADIIRDKTGLLVDPYFSATKIKWLLDNVSGAREKARAGKILAGTVDSYLIWRLSGGAVHVTDRTNASRTMLYNIHTLEWDSELLEMLDIPREILPNVLDSSCVYAMTDKKVCGFEVPIAAAVGDQQAALFGQCCLNAGEAKATYGTGCFLLMNTGEEAVKSKHKLLTTIALSMNGRTTYALEGSVFMGGATIKWLRDELSLIKTAHECDEEAEKVEDSNGVIIVPAFTGLGAPYWDSYARGIIVGLTRGVNKAHICRATLEAIALQVKDELECMKEDAACDIKALKVDGGVCVSEVMLQFQSDILNTNVIRPKNTETTVMGAAFLAGLATGFWQSEDELKEKWEADKTFSPNMKEEERSIIYKRWKLAVEHCKGWAK